MSITQAVSDFTTLAIQNGGWMEMDRHYLENKIYRFLKVKKTPLNDSEKKLMSSHQLIEELVSYAFREGEKPSQDQKDEVTNQLVELLTPPPSVVNAFFAQYYEKDPQEATNYLYNLMCLNQWVLSENSDVGNDYTYCFENEGEKWSQQRIIRMNLLGESWGFEYKRHPNFREHFSVQPESMREFVVNRATLEKMAELVRLFPHYFVTCSTKVTAETHFEGGLGETPLMRIKGEEKDPLAFFPQMKWERLVSEFLGLRIKIDQQPLLFAVIEWILLQWQSCSGELTREEQTIQFFLKQKEGTWIVELLFGTKEADERLESHFELFLRTLEE